MGAAAAGGSPGTGETGAAKKKTQPVRDAADFVGGRMEDMLSKSDMEKVITWMGVTGVEATEGPVRRGDFYKDLRATRNFQQWKSVVRRKLSLSPTDADSYQTRAELFKLLLERSPFTIQPPFP